MEKNVGTIDAYIRITGGVYLVGYGIVKKSSLAIILGSMKIAEGTTRWCPMLHTLGISTRENKKNNSSEKNQQSNSDYQQVY